MAPRLILMCGPAFAGKTVLAGAIADRLGCVRISLDEIHRERGLPPGGEGVPTSEWEASARVAEERVRAALASERSVVLDDTCCFRFVRDRYRALATEEESDCVVVCLDVPQDELWRRLRSNREAPTRPDVADHLFAMYLAGFEWPTDDEEALPYRPEEAPADWIDRHLR